jgi:predicted MFS family arabinose efflux permease
MGPAYVMVSALYVVAFLLSLGVAGPPHRARPGGFAEAIAGLRQAVAYVWHKPDQLGAFSIAFLVNLLAFPFVLGLLPYIAKDFYQVERAGLGYLAASFATGALAGSLFLGAARVPMRAARVMLASAAVWFAAIVLLGQFRSLAVGCALLLVSGFAQSLCMTPLAAVMLRSASDEMRGRVMGMRMLAIWGLPLGLVAAGPIIEHWGYPATTLLYAGIGLAATFAVAYRWRGALWHPSAAANR